MSECRVQLRRDRVDTAWGFRLQGGQDFSSPLVVQRVFSGSPADGQLQRGDMLMSINNTDVSRMQQKQAEEFIKTTGNSLNMVVKRSGGGYQNNVQNYASEPLSQPMNQMSDGHGGSSPYRPAQAPVSPISDGYNSLPRKYGGQANVWSPNAPSSGYQAPSVLEGSPQRSYGGGGGGYDQQPASTPSYQPVSFQKPAAAPSPGGFGGNQFSDSSPRHEAAPKSGPGTSWRGAQPSGAHNEQPSQIPVHHEYSSSPYLQGTHHTTAAAPRFVEEMSPPPAHPTVIGGQNAEDEEEYESKSVREIKAMFNKPSKPIGPQRSSNKPIKFQPKPSPAVSYNKSSPSPSWGSSPSKQTFSQQSRAFSPASQPISQRPAVFSPQAKDPYSDRGWPSLSPPPQPQPVTGLLKPKTVSSSLKPGAGYSYQGIVTVTPAKTVHQGNKSSGGGSGSSGGAQKKKEFDPSQSLVLQMLQEENERAKRGETGPEEESNDRQGSPTRRRPQQQQQQQQQQQRPPQPQRSGRLQELLERDQAQMQQEERQQQQYQQQQQQQQQYQQPQQPQQQQRMPQQSHQSGGGRQGSYQQPQQQQYQQPQQQYHQPQPQYAGGYQSYQNEPQYGGGYQAASSPGNYHQQGQRASQHDYYNQQQYDDGVPISDF